MTEGPTFLPTSRTIGSQSSSPPHAPFLQLQFPPGPLHALYSSYLAVADFHPFLCLTLTPSLTSSLDVSPFSDRSFLFPMAVLNPLCNRIRHSELRSYLVWGSSFFVCQHFVNPKTSDFWALSNCGLCVCFCCGRILLGKQKRLGILASSVNFSLAVSKARAHLVTGRVFHPPTCD